MKIKQTSLGSPRIEMLPLIDIVFLLLVFFIYAMLSMAVHRGQTVDLPMSSTAPTQMDKAVQVTVQDTGGGFQLLVDGSPVSIELFGKQLQHVRQSRVAGERVVVQLFADKTISYQELFTVMDEIKNAGLAEISLQAVAARHE
jgi:biopolymer transport protein ExbD